MIPFDFGGASLHALQWAADLHKTTGGEPILMVHVINSLPVGVLEVVVDPLLPNKDEILDLERSMQEQARKLDVPATVKVLIQGRIPGETIVAAARDAKADLIVMGTHGRTGVNRLLLGSVAEHVLRHSPCPVVTVRGSKTD
jgi:nucleotide-binding universal stress UspA family protein